MYEAVVRLGDVDGSGTIRRTTSLARARHLAEAASVVGDGRGYSEFTAARVPKRGDNFFVLGSGASIADLTTQHYRLMERNFTVGVNAWPIHPFIPDAYAFERVAGNPAKAQAIGACLNRREVLEKDPAVWMEAGALWGPVDECIAPPSRLSAAYHYVKFPVATRRTSALEAAFRDIFFMHERGEAPPSAIPGVGASIERMVGIGLLAGYANIVLVGVDLNHTDYFWEVDPIHLRNRGLSAFASDQAKSVHRTNDPDEKLFPVQVTIHAMAEAAATAGKGKVLIASSKSALAAVLDVYNWEEAP